MQYPVPQFTDVEDKIIGMLTIRQFGIIFGAGVLVLLVFMATKSVAAIIVAAVIIGIPALGIAFAQVNGRPMYKMFPFVYKFFTSPRLLVFHKEARNFSGAEKVRDVEMAAPVKVVVKQTAKQRISKVNELLKKKQQEEDELMNQLK
jgi:hypothetical protein